MPSLFTWLDYSEADRRRMLDIVSLLDEKETRDELGLGSIRDAFADLFFPGTSTIQTRARYFLFIPWIYQRLERQKTPRNEIAAKARRAEIDLMRVIEGSEEREGNIGRRAQERLKRLPSNVYWQGTWSWGIRTFVGSQDQYHNSVDSFYKQMPQRAHRPEEDEMEEASACNWHPGIVSPPPGFPAGSSFELRFNEADYLADRICSRHSDKLIAKLLKLRTETTRIAFVWEHPRRGEFSSSQIEQMAHARNFSELMYGPVLVYNLLLLRQTRQAEEEIVESIREWVDLMEEGQERFQTWDRARFWQIVESNGGRIALTTRSFVNEWWDMCLAEPVANLVESASVHQLVRNREKLLKRGLARLGNPRAGELWTGASGLGRLDFRWGIAQRLLNDIITGLERGNDDAQT